MQHTGAIDEITSKIYVKVDSTGKRRIVRFWNPTVANLSLMALGSSAPEIMLNVMEIVLGNFYAGALGPCARVCTSHPMATPAEGACPLCARPVRCRS